MQEKTTFGLHLFGASVRAAFKMAAVWLAGMTVGGYLSTKISSVFNPYFDHILSAGFLVWSVMHILLVPLFASICLYLLFGPDGVLPVVFLKAFGFSLTVAICAVTFKSAGWLVSRFVFFSDLWGIPVLLWLWFSLLRRRLHKRGIVISVLCILAIGLTDYFVIFPFLSAVL